jgi:hypothetical protein
MDRVGQLSFEIKDGYNGIVTRGTADYQLIQGDKVTDVKMRSHRNRAHEVYTVVNGREVLVRDNCFPGKELLDRIRISPHAVERAQPHIIENIVKVGDMRQRQETLGKMGLTVGDTLKSVRLMREFSLSQFLFKNRKQRAAWERLTERDKELYGQSVERAFLNPDGTLDYARMVEEVQRAISSEVAIKKPRSSVETWGNAYENMVKGNKTKHPHYENYLLLKKLLFENSVNWQEQSHPLPKFSLTRQGVQRLHCVKRRSSLRYKLKRVSKSCHVA